ncbi:PIN domain-containing protein [Candidatus Pacearchaeota archaeon]|nr:PIN domain-containing protein [Candidatus Pacearchaeota archaeon]
MNIIIDTNIFISALIKDSLTREIIVNSPFHFFIPEGELIEIKKYEKLIIKKSGLSAIELKELIRILLKYMNVVRNDLILEHKNKAKEIMGKIDKDDVIFIATALAKNAVIWSDDKHFQKQKEIKIFTTKEIKNL